MSGLENIEILEAPEGLKTPSVSELQEQREQLRSQADIARESGRTEECKYFLWEMAKVDGQISQFENREGEAMLGEGHACGHSESYWKEQAAKELAEHGKTTWYDTCKKRLREAIENEAREDAKLE